MNCDDCSGVSYTVNNKKYVDDSECDTLWHITNLPRSEQLTLIPHFQRLKINPKSTT